MNQKEKYSFDENIAFEAIQCAFNKVWLYPTFDMSKSHCKDEENAIVIWLIKIAVSQMFQTHKTVCLVPQVCRVSHYEGFEIRL